MTAPSAARAESSAPLFQRYATWLIFLVVGLATATWAPLVPFVKERLALSESALGLLLLCIGLGSLAAMPVAGILCGRLGCRRVIGVFGAVLVGILALLAAAPATAVMAAALLVFGAAMGTVDVTMNVQSVLVQKEFKKPIISGCHGFFSLGGLLGASAMALLLGAGMRPLAAVGCMIGAMGLLLAVGLPHCLPYGSESKAPLFVRPRGTVLLLGVLCFVLFLAEGAVLDWSAVFLREERAMSAASAAWGYAVFSLAMTVGRFCGDRFVQAFGARKTLFFGALLGTGGYLTVALLPWGAAGLIGFVCVGLGVSNLVPVLFSMTGKQDAMPLNLAMASVCTLGYFGILAGPALIGFVAHATSLWFAFLLVALGLLGVALCARYRLR